MFTTNNINILEKIDSIDTIVLDKTRTITTGIPTINSINKHCDLDEREILEILVSIEKHSINNLCHFLYLRQILILLL